MDKECECGWTGTRIGIHWHYNPEHRPDLSKRQKDILKGLLMGDAWMHPNGYMALEMIKEDFLGWLHEELGVLSCGVKLKGTAEELANKNREYGYTVNEENYNDLYRLRTVKHPYIEDMLEWYDTEEKVFPEHIDITPLLLKVWYCCDGNLYNGDNAYWDARIAAYNEISREEELMSNFTNIGLSPKIYNGVIVFGKHQRNEFMDYIGKPLPGFDYKWKHD